VSQPLAYHLALKSRFITPLEIYFPQKNANISVVNPLEGLNSLVLRPSATIKTDGQIQENILYIDDASAHKLTGTPENYYSSVEIYLSPSGKKSLSPNKMKGISKSLEEIFPNCNVKDKQQQNSTLYKVIKAEKFAVYLILFFVILIISINIFSCLSMLITDKTEDIETYLSLGATKELVAKIFHLHGFLISLSGCIIGTGIGIVLALAQQEFGIVSLSGSYLIDAYPVDLRITDILIIFIGVTAIGFLISYLPVKNFFKN
jgi:ABC-type lipoprotein release transport system permease subunit